MHNCEIDTSSFSDLTLLTGCMTEMGVRPVNNLAPEILKKSFFRVSSNDLWKSRLGNQKKTKTVVKDNAMLL